MGERPAQRFDVFRAADVSARENLDDIGAGVPSCDDFGRGQRPGANHFGVALHHFDGGELQARSHEKLSAGKHAGARCFRIEDRSGAEHDLITELICDLFESANCAGNRHGNLGSANAAAMDGFDRFDGALARRRAYHWDNYNIDDEGEDLLFSHLKTGFRISDFGSVNSNPQCYQSTTEPSSAS